ncbi:EGFR-like transmembrane domain-containing protein [Paramicrobacterium chengjingii]|uniref:EGFR-like transmembrane domain-containing protein n=1 Tax=Paramicrobacterium chengjingii TaxID=2769067 RepID=UPI001422ABF7|nr:transmembrane domain-containing protein [Microbacterium chengjingii]
MSSAIAQSRHDGETGVARWKRGVIALMALTVAFILTACGAVVDTTLVIKADGSGSRAISATVEADDLEKVDGGAAAIDKAITENIPEGMAYGGQKAGSDGAAVYSFTIEFDSQSDYEEKVIGILGAGGVTDIETEIEIVVADSVFREGVSVNENFTSQDLLQWLVEAMVKSGIVDDDDKDDLTEIGKTVVEVDGVGHDSSAKIEYSDIADYGIRDLNVTTDGIGTGAYERTISYDLSRETYSRDTDAYDEFFTKATPKGGTLTEPDEASTVWTISFSAKDEKQLIDYTNTALNSESTDFAVSSETDADDPTMFHTSVIDFVDCGQICNEDAEVSSNLVLPKGWQGDNGGAGEDGWSMPISHDPVVFDHRVQFESVVAAASVAPSGENTLTIDYVLSVENADLVGSAMQEFLEPASTVADLSVDAGKKAVTYTITVVGEDAAETNSRLDEYLPGSQYSVVESDSSLFTRSYSVNMIIALPRDLLSGGVADGITYRVDLPAGASVADSSELPKGAKIAGNVVAVSEDSPSSPEFRVDASSPNIGGIITLGVIVLFVLLIIAAVVFLVIRQKKKAAAAGPNGGLFSYDGDQTGNPDASAAGTPSPDAVPPASPTSAGAPLAQTAVLDESATEQLPEPSSESPTEVLPPRPPLPPNSQQ